MFELRTDYPVAWDSPDHLEPWGTRSDNSINKAFNRRLFRLFPPTKPIRVLDLGCAGGGFIESVVEAGHIGVGLEGSDWSAQLGRAAWGKTKTLFTCDITKPFQILENGEPMKFDVITSWVVFEHIKEEDLPTLIENMQKHLAPNGIVMLTIGGGPDWVNGVNLHQTVKSREWWIEKLPFKNDENLLAYFGKHLVRYDHPVYDFRFAMRNGPAPALPKSSLKDRIKDSLRETNLVKKLNL